jgi:hypothetical protein
MKTIKYAKQVGTCLVAGFVAFLAMKVLFDAGAVQAAMELAPIPDQSIWSPSTWGNTAWARGRADMFTFYGVNASFLATAAGVLVALGGAATMWRNAKRAASDEERRDELMQGLLDALDAKAGNGSNHPAPTQEELLAQAEKAEREAAEAQAAAQAAAEAARHQRALVPQGGGGATHPKKQQAAKA